MTPNSLACPPGEGRTLSPDRVLGPRGKGPQLFQTEFCYGSKILEKRWPYGRPSKLGLGNPIRFTTVQKNSPAPRSGTDTGELHIRISFTGRNRGRHSSDLNRLLACGAPRCFAQVLFSGYCSHQAVESSHLHPSQDDCPSLSGTALPREAWKLWRRHPEHLLQGQEESGEKMNFLSRPWLCIILILRI